MTTIGLGTFYGCTSLAKFEGPLATSDQRCIVIDGALVAFAPAELFEYVIPEGVTSIGERAFYRCSSLTSITLPEGMTTIGEDAFSDCTSLVSITLPEGLTTIKPWAFAGCTSLTSIIIPESVTSIRGYAFRFCSSLAKFEGPLATSDQRCIVIDGALVAFAPAKLFEYVIPEGVTTIEGGAFSYCTSLKSITIPEGLTTIGEDAFCGCKSLTSITLPEGVTEIGQGAFYQCASLASVYCKPITPPTGGVKMFHHNASGRKIYVPAGSVDAYKAAEYWEEYAPDIVAEE